MPGESRRSVIALARHSAEAAAITFKCSAEPNLPETVCDAEQIKQVLLNLIINAIQATGEGEIDLRAWSTESELCISVRDGGGGVAPGQEERIFEPFYTTRETGSGLGLAIAAQIVEQHGGTLTAKNNEGEGLEMTLHLPLTQAIRAGA